MKFTYSSIIDSQNLNCTFSQFIDGKLSTEFMLYYKDNIVLLSELNDDLQINMNEYQTNITAISTWIKSIDLLMPYVKRDFPTITQENYQLKDDVIIGDFNISENNFTLNFYKSKKMYVLNKRNEFKLTYGEFVTFYNYKNNFHLKTI